MGLAHHFDCVTQVSSMKSTAFIRFDETNQMESIERLKERQSQSNKRTLHYHTSLSFQRAKR